MGEGDNNKEGSGEMPRHIAIIMDGNRRWARLRHIDHARGHRQGVDALRRIIHAANDMAVSYLSIYGFSVNNWRRADEEVDALMRMVRAYLRSDLAELHHHCVRLKFLGSREGIDLDIIDLIDHAQCLTGKNEGMVLAIAFNYGGRDEIIRAARRLVKEGRVINFDEMERALDSHPMPPVDLLIRTGGEQRLSDFLLWQSAYAELVFTKTLWPDFTPALFQQLVRRYHERDRRFGGDSLTGDDMIRDMR